MKQGKIIDRSGWVRTHADGTIWEKFTQKLEGGISLKEIGLTLGEVCIGDKLILDDSEKGYTLTCKKQYDKHAIFNYAVSAHIDGNINVATGEPRWYKCVKINAFGAMNADDWVEIIAWWEAKQ
jgi:hypothetical protein